MRTCRAVVLSIRCSAAEAVRQKQEGGHHNWHVREQHWQTRIIIKKIKCDNRTGIDNHIHIWTILVKTNVPTATSRPAQRGASRTGRASGAAGAGAPRQVAA